MLLDFFVSLQTKPILMKKPSLKNILDLTFFAILVIFSVLVYSTYNRAQQVKQNRLLVNNVSNVNDVLEKVLSNSIDMETGARGFTLTGEEDYLSVYKQGRIDVKTWIDSLVRLTSDHSVKLQNLRKLENLIAARDSISAVMINTRKDKGLQAAVDIVKTGKGKRIMDSIRISVMDNQKEALKVLKANLKYTEENVKARNINFALFTIITLVITTFAYVKIRQMAKLLLKDREIQQNLVDELTIQNRQVNEFASITSHNLRSPAANITALVSMIDADTSLEEYRESFGMLEKISGNLNESLHQLTEVLSIRRNTLVETEKIILADTFNKTLDSLQGQINETQAEISCDFQKAPQLNYPRIYLESIFHNLISNALKYSKPNVKPQVHMWSELSGGQVLLHIKDNGIGIDLNRHGHKMFGMSQKFTNHPDSKGIGLFMTKAQIESMNGTIAVESKPGLGTTFTISFSQ